MKAFLHYILEVKTEAQVGVNLHSKDVDSVFQSNGVAAEPRVSKQITH